MNSEISIIKIAKVSQYNNMREKSIIKNSEIDLWEFMIKIYEKIEIKLENYQYIDRYMMIWNKSRALIDRLFHY